MLQCGDPLIWGLQARPNPPIRGVKNISIFFSSIPAIVSIYRVVDRITYFGEK
jgi:hypothetical protein